MKKLVGLLLTGLILQGCSATKEASTEGMSSAHPVEAPPTIKKMQGPPPGNQDIPKSNRQSSK